MGAQFKTLFSVEKVTDHDCGNYVIGELETHETGYAVRDYIKQYGEKGYVRLITELAGMTAHIHRCYMKTAEANSMPAVEAKS